MANNEGRVITAEIRAEALRRLQSFYRPYTDEDRYRIEDEVAREWETRDESESAGE